MDNYLQKLQDCILNSEEFSKLFKLSFTSDLSELFDKKFVYSKIPYLHEYKFQNGDKIALKFCNVIKRIRNSKNIEIPGKESWLSYIEVTVSPFKNKAYCYSLEISQFTWAKAGKTKATELHNKKLETLKLLAEKFGINLNNSSSWFTVYTDNY